MSLPPYSGQYLRITNSAYADELNQADFVIMYPEASQRLMDLCETRATTGVSAGNQPTVCGDFGDAELLP
jgi:hypothetical protein